MKQTMFMIAIIATIAITVIILPSLNTGSLHSVMAQGQNMTGGNSTEGNITETESITAASPTGTMGPICTPSAVTVPC